MFVAGAWWDFFKAYFPRSLLSLWAEVTYTGYLFFLHTEVLFRNRVLTSSVCDGRIIYRLVLGPGVGIHSVYDHSGHWLP